jgi:ADP-ribose pyrophosphatase
MFKKIKQNLIYSDNWLSFFQDEIEFPDHTKGTYAWTDRKSGVGVVVVTPDKKILLNKEYRYVIKDYSWEVPGGGIDEGETPEQAAIRELWEETGIRVDEVEKLGRIYPLHSFNTEHVTLFLARSEALPLNTHTLESSEHVAEQKFVTFDEALKMIDTGEINDSTTAHVIQMVVRKLSK